MNIKKILVGAAATAMILGSIAVPALAAGAQQIPWNLSGAVMPVPPYGSLDIPGSDTSSKLIFNQPNGKVKGMVTGAMNGLNPNTTYTVYLSNTYTKYVPANVAGSYAMHVLYMGSDYDYSLSLDQTGNSVSGTLHDPYLPVGLQDMAVSGTVSDNVVSFSVNYPTNYQGVRTFTGNIASGNLSGSWNETGTENGFGTWSTTNGVATLASGSTGWPGLLSGTTPFTFVTDSTGSGSWHYNFTGPVSPFSVWINEAGGTMLISNPILPTP